jgi:hypothetical protein
MEPTPGKLSGTIANLFTDVEITEMYSMVATRAAANFAPFGDNIA